MFWGVSFFAFAIMVWVLSGVVGGGWFWGAEGRLSLRGARRLILASSPSFLRVWMTLNKGPGIC